MAKRKGMSPRTRFEILKRDGFRCRYCGATAMASVLQVDHVVAIANGGTDDPANLVTSCEPCNAGKSGVPLEQPKLKPAVSPAKLREHAKQIAGYLAACRELEATRDRFRQHIADQWMKAFGEESMPVAFVTRLVNVVEKHGMEVCMEAISIAASRASRLHGDNRIMYFNGVVRKLVAAT